MRHVWLAFVDLGGTRDVGMALGAITFREIQAYQHLTHAMLSAWEVRLIRRLDASVRAMLAAPAKGGTVSAASGAGVRALFKGIAARKAKGAG